MKHEPIKRLISLMLVVTLAAAGMDFRAKADTLQFPSALTEIAAGAFDGDSSLDEADIPWGARTIGSRAFADSGLKMIYIPSTVYSIAEDAFDDGVTIASAANSHARLYAEKMNIAWEDCGEHYPQEADANPEEGWDSGLEPLTTESLTAEAVQPLSEDGITDENILTHIREMNALAESINSEAEAYNTSVQELYAVMEELNGALAGYTGEESGGDEIFCFDGLNIQLDMSMQNGTTVSTDEDGALVLSSVSGEPYTVSVTGDTFRISAGGQARSRTVSAETWWGQIQKIIKFLQDIYDSVSGKLWECITNAKAAIAKWDQAERDVLIWYNRLKQTEYYQNEPAAMARITAQKEQSLRWINEERNKQILRRDRLLRWQGAVAKINIGLRVYQLGQLYEKHQQVNEMRAHGHPTEHDLYMEGLDYSELLNKNLQYLDKALAVDAALTVVSVISTLVSISSLAGFPLVSLASAVIAWASLFAGMSVGVKQETLWEKVKELDAELHCSVNGVVMDEDTRELLEGVAISRNGTDAIAYTDALGKFEVYLPRITGSLVFSLEDYENEPVQIRLTPYEPEYKTVYMKKETGTISGVVYDKDSRLPIEGARVTCGEDVQMTGADGNFRFDVVPGDYEVTAGKDGYVEDSKAVTVEKDQQKVIDIPLEARIAIHNRAELEAVAQDPNTNYYLANDISLAGEPWTPLPWFGGSLDGCGHTISGMVINTGNGGNTGLFTGLYGGEIINMKLSDFQINVAIDSTFANIGGIGGGLNNDAVLKDVDVSGSITVTDGTLSNTNAYVGGFGGFGNGLWLNDCVSAVTIIVESGYNVYAGGFAGGISAGGTVSCESLSGVNVRQTGSNTGASFNAYGTSYYGNGNAYGCRNSGGVAVYTTDGCGSAYGLCTTDHGTNSGPVTATTQNGTADAYGCYMGANNINNSAVKAIATGTGSATASGVRNIAGGANTGGVEATAKSGTATAGGASYVSGTVNNSGGVHAYSESGDAVAVGLSGGTQCKNTKAVSAKSVSGSALAIGVQESAGSRNSGNVTAECDSGNVGAQGLSHCSNGANSGDVKGIYTGEGGMAKSVSVHGLSDCTWCTNSGYAEGHVLKTKTTCTIAGIAGGSYNSNFGDVLAESEEGPTVARGAWNTPNSQNYGDVTATAKGEQANATAYGAGNSNGCLNEGTVTAISEKAAANAYGVGGGSGSVSTGAVTAESHLLTINTLEDGTKEVYYGAAYAYNSTQVTARLAGHTIAASGGGEQRLYFLLREPGCYKHSGNEPELRVWNKGNPEVDQCGCFKLCGVAVSVNYGDYVMPE